MTDILSIIKAEFPGKYDYLRLGLVKLEGNRLNVTFLVPEDVYDYHLKNEDIHNIEEAVKNAIGQGYRIYFHYEKIVLTEENVRSALAEYLSKYFPLVAANLDFSKVVIRIESGMNIEFTVQKNIREYMEKVDFDRKLKEFFEKKYSLSIGMAFHMVDDNELSFTPAQMSSGRYGKTVTVTDKVLMMGKIGDLHDPAVHISTLKGEGEDVVCCGRVVRLAFKTRDESKRGEYKKFFKHYYTFAITDTTGFLNVFINTDDEFGALVNGAEVVCKGRVNTRDDMSKSMYVKAIALCKIPFSTIAEQTKPLDPPRDYSVLRPKQYTEVTYDQIGFDFFDVPGKKHNNPTANGVSIAIRSLKAERVAVPYEIALCQIEKGKITEYMHTFLKVAFTEESDVAEYANRMGYSSPRLSTIIPDLVKFTADKVIIGLNPAGLLEILNAIAKPLRYVFSNDVHVIQPAALKEDSGRRENALDEAIALANAYISE